MTAWEIKSVRALNLQKFVAKLNGEIQAADEALQALELHRSQLQVTIDQLNREAQALYQLHVNELLSKENVNE